MQHTHRGRQMSSFFLSPQGGVVTNWRVGAMDILYPQQIVAVGNEQKLRGGVHVCFPNFGEVPRRHRLPKHGFVRGLDGIKQSDPTFVESTVTFAKGKKGNWRHCKVKIAASLQEGGRQLRYSLRADLEKNRDVETLPFNLGMHPYFSTPYGEAMLHVGGSSYPIQGLIEEPRYIPYGGRAALSIPGCGAIEIWADHRLAPLRTAHLVLWRDSIEYVCVEPILELPEVFDTARGSYLRAGEPFSASVTFLVR